MNILLSTIFQYLPPGGGGLSTYVKNLKTGLEKMGHSVDVLAHHPGEARYYLYGKDLHIHKQTLPKPELRRVAGFKYVNLDQVDARIRIFEDEKIHYRNAAIAYGLENYDVIHVQDVIAAQVMARIKPKRIPLVTTTHGSMAFDSAIQGLTGSFQWCYAAHQDYYGVSHSDGVIIPSRWLKEKLVEASNAPASRMTVIPNGIDVNQFLSRMNEPLTVAPAAGKQIIACVARFIPEKGHKVLLQALVKLKQKRKDWICWLIGEGPLRVDIENLTRDLELEGHIVFLGARDDVPALLRESDLVVLPSVYENMPYALVEAQLAGKPIIASDGGGIKEVVEHGVNGLISPAGHIWPLYSYMLQLLEDAPLRAQLGRQGKERATVEYSTDTMMNRIMKVYHGLIG